MPFHLSHTHKILSKIISSLYKVPKCAFAYLWIPTIS